MTDDGPGVNCAVAVVGLHPVVVRYPNLRGVDGRHPDRLASSGQRKHVQVVVVLRVDAPFVVRGHVPHRYDRRAIGISTCVSGRWLIVDMCDIEWGAEDRKALTHVTHPVVIQVIVHSSGEGMPRLVPLHVNDEG